MKSTFLPVDPPRVVDEGLELEAEFVGIAPAEVVFVLMIEEEIVPKDDFGFAVVVATE
jgi:hypothetical protein